MKSMFLSFIISSLLYVNLFADGCCSSCNSCKKPTHTDSGSYKQGTHSGLGNHKPGLHADTDKPKLPPITELHEDLNELKSDKETYKLKSDEDSDKTEPHEDPNRSKPAEDTDKSKLGKNKGKTEPGKKTDEAEQLTVENNILKLNNNVLNELDVDDNTKKKIVCIQDGVTITFYNINYDVFKGGINCDVKLKDNIQYIIATVKTNEDKYYLLKIMIKNSNTKEKPEFKAENVFLAADNDSIVTEIRILYSSENITSLRNIFVGCKNLKYIDLSNLKTQNVTTMFGMFCNCNSLKCLDLSNFDTRNVTCMNVMFSSCNSLKCLDLSNFDTSNVKSMNIMFLDCNKLEKIYITGKDNTNLITAVKNEFGENECKFNNEKTCITINKSK